MTLDPLLNGLPDNFPAGFATAGRAKAERLTPVKSHFHLLGVGGVAMAALAGLLQGRGYKVTGADGDIYPPMSDILADLKIPVTKGFERGTLPSDAVVVVGNVVTRQFPVVLDLLESGQPYLSLPQTLGELFLAKTKNLVVAGCHGKTSVTNLVASLLEKAGLAPGYLIGGQSLDLKRSYQDTQNGWFVIEGDEYDSAFFQKVPKFIYYRPHLVILTGVEFDHADIYPDLEAVVAAYGLLMDLIPAEGLLLANGDDPLCRRLAKQVKGQVKFYGQNLDNDWRLVNYRVETGLDNSLNQGLDALNQDQAGVNPRFAFEIAGPGVNLSLKWSRPGQRNALNAVAALAAAMMVGVQPAVLPTRLAQIQGARRRQEVLGVWGGIRLIDDFAHHPTAVAKTLEAFKEAYPGRLMVVFEPRSATTRRAVFQQQYVEALTQADVVFLGPVNRPDKAPEGDRLDPVALAQAIAKKRQCQYFPELPALAPAILAEARAGDTIALMSNGDFGGLAKILAQGLAKQSERNSLAEQVEQVVQGPQGAQ
jgi:UDP-N-acetylmuramate: L-alanyl-gamma-D-glutamyl-meso-diaminopimelate ligase